MNSATVRIARIYLTEGKHQLERIMETLHDTEKVRGVTVFRGISGFGRSGKMHSSKLLDLSMNLPVVVEFWDAPEKMGQILDHLSMQVEPGHIVSWSAEVNEE
jgi:PII-like signaling protein